MPATEVAESCTHNLFVLFIAKLLVFVKRLLIVLILIILKFRESVWIACGEEARVGRRGSRDGVGGGSR